MNSFVTMALFINKQQREFKNNLEITMKRLIGQEDNNDIAVIYYESISDEHISFAIYSREDYKKYKDLAKSFEYKGFGNYTNEFLSEEQVENIIKFLD